MTGQKTSHGIADCNITACFKLLVDYWKSTGQRNSSTKDKDRAARCSINVAGNVTQTQNEKTASLNEQL